MFDKRLIQMCPESRKFIAGNIILQFFELCFNAVMIVMIAFSVQKLYERVWGLQDLILPFAVMGFNGMLILLGAFGLLAPAAGALLHNTSTVLLSMDCLTDLLSAEGEETHETRNDRKAVPGASFKNSL